MDDDNKLYFKLAFFLPNKFTLRISLVTLAKTEKYNQKVWQHKWISYQINIRHLRQLRKLKPWELFWSYMLSSTANPAHSPQNWAKFALFEISAEPWPKSDSHGLLLNVI